LPAKVGLEPKPAVVVFECAGVGTVEIREGDTLLGNAGEPISLSPFEDHLLEFVADDHRKTRRKVHVSIPGAFYKKPTRIVWETAEDAQGSE